MNLTDDSSNELSDELVKRQGLVSLPLIYIMYNIQASALLCTFYIWQVLDDSTCDDDGSNWDEWVPDPVDANPSTVWAAKL